MRANTYPRAFRRNRKMATITQNSKSKPLEVVGQLTQICLAVVAVFGYFYTVQPIYQKDRLEEQVAEFEGVIKKHAPRVAEIEAELQKLQNERGKLGTELRNIQAQLHLARQEKAKVEKQTEFMAYRYRLPDGKPAVTQEEVAIAQVHELKSSFRSSLKMHCGLLSSDKNVPSYSYEKYDSKNKFWPFSENEFNVLKEYGNRYPLQRALDCINSLAASYKSRQGANLTEVENLRQVAAARATQASARPWTFSAQPQELIKALATRMIEIESELKAEKAKVENEYGSWESVFLSDRRAIYKNNYEVGLKNAEMKAYTDRVNIQYETQGHANTLRKNIQNEVTRLISEESK